MHRLRIPSVLRCGSRAIGDGGFNLDSPLPLKGRDEDLSDRSYTMQGSLNQRHVNDERFMQTKVRPSPAMSSLHDAASNFSWGTNTNRFRQHAISVPAYVAGERDAGVCMRRRLALAPTNAWGFVIPHLRGLYKHLQQQTARSSTPGRFHALTYTTKATATAESKAPAVYSRETVRREFIFEVDRYASVLEDSLDATATLVLLGQLLRLHSDLGISSRDVASLSLRHRALLQRVVQELTFRVEADLKASPPRMRQRQLSRIVSDANAFLEEGCGDCAADDGLIYDERPSFRECHARLRRVEADHGRTVVVPIIAG